MTSNGEQGVASFFFFLMTELRGFLTAVSTSVSDHMDQRPRRNNVCRDLAQTSVRTANTLHPSMLAARLLFTLCSRHMPSKHITKAEITFWNAISTAAIQLPTAPAVYRHKQATLASHFSTTVSSLLFWSLPSLCQWAYWRHHPQVMEKFWRHTSQLANICSYQ